MLGKRKMSAKAVESVPGRSGFLCFLPSCLARRALDRAGSIAPNPSSAGQLLGRWGIETSTYMFTITLSAHIAHRERRAVVKGQDSTCTVYLLEYLRCGGGRIVLHIIIRALFESLLETRQPRAAALCVFCRQKAPPRCSLSLVSPKYVRCSWNNYWSARIGDFVR